MKTIVNDVSQAFQSVKTEQPHNHHGVFRFSEKMSVLKGHFPGHPIVPGVYLLECAVQTFCRGEKKAMQTLQVKQAKFMAPVHPPCDIDVIVSGKQTESGWKVDCTIHQGETVAVTALLEMIEQRREVG